MARHLQFSGDYYGLHNYEAFKCWNHISLTFVFPRPVQSRHLINVEWMMDDHWISSHNKIFMRNVAYFKINMKLPNVWIRGTFKKKGSLICKRIIIEVCRCWSNSVIFTTREGVSSYAQSHPNSKGLLTTFCKNYLDKICYRFFNKSQTS